jgi:sn-glycerol 3-phosphate transport system ATP-binding protein
MVYVTHDQTEAMTMADQVVLLKNGRIEQVGTPHCLYEYPATTFAARFIGSPPMNLVAPDLIEDLSFPSPEGRAGPFSDNPKGWLVGIRPEHLKLSDRGLPVRVGAVDYLGSETVLRLHHGKQSLFIRVNGKNKITTGDQLKISCPFEAMHIFNEKGFREESA